MGVVAVPDRVVTTLGGAILDAAEVVAAMEWVLKDSSITSPVTVETKASRTRFTVVPFKERVRAMAGSEISEGSELEGLVVDTLFGDAHRAQGADGRVRHALRSAQVDVVLGKVGDRLCE